MLLAVCQFFSCQKATVQNNNLLFLKTFSSDSSSSQKGYYLEQLADGGFMIVSNQGNYPLITRTDKYGNIISKKYVKNHIFSGWTTLLFNIFNTSDPYHFLAQYGQNFLIFDSSGTTEKSAQIPFVAPHTPTSSLDFGYMMPQGNGNQTNI